MSSHSNFNPNPNPPPPPPPPPPPDRRRPLSFPAVHPSDSISPATLLSSLLTLSQTILNLNRNHNNPFFTQRRNAREATRQVSLLYVFLQDLRPSNLPNDAVSSLSDLHFAFQNLHFLLHDCACVGPRLFMLLKSRHVASLFRSVFRAVATALESLPLHRIKVCLEVRELFELVTKQARKAKFELDVEDEAEAERVSSVLNQFERGTEPDLNSMKRILNYLEIKTWIDCNREVKFLEVEMLCFESSASDEEEVALLSGLIGFLCYCRGVIFETVDFTSLKNAESSEARRGVAAEVLSCERRPPEDYRCPISLEMMTDPVTTSTGQTYDRSSIQKWLKGGNRVCPKTGERLSTTELVPNTTLKRLIQQFCADNGISLAKSISRSRGGSIARTAEAGSPATAHAVQFLCWFLARRLVFGTEEQQNKAAYEARLLARSNVFNRACLIEVGVVPPLLDLLTTSDRTMQENSMAALLKLSKHGSGQQCIMESRGLAPILRVLKRGLCLEARQIAAATIFYLCSVEEYRKIIGKNPEAIPSLVEMIREGVTTTKHKHYPTGTSRRHRLDDVILYGIKNAVVAIFGLLLHPRNQPRVLEAGAVPALVGVLSSSMDKEDLITDCLAVLAALAESSEGSGAILQAKALHLIIMILQSVTSRVAKEHCVSILMSLCNHIGAEVVGVLVEEPSLMPLLYSILTDGTPHAAKKARSLIRVLQEFNEQRASGLEGTSVSSRQQLVHLN